MVKKTVGTCDAPVCPEKREDSDVEALEAIV